MPYSTVEEKSFLSTLEELSGVELQQIAPQLVLVSEAAFSAPPWHICFNHAERLRRFMSFSQVHFFVVRTADSAEIAGFSVGCILERGALQYIGAPEQARLKSGDYHLLWRAVNPIFQGKGIGTVLTKIRMDKARIMGCSAVHGETRHDNLGTLLMHKRLGFYETTRRHLVDNRGLCEKIYLSKSLT